MENVVIATPALGDAGTTDSVGSEVTGLELSQAFQFGLRPKLWRADTLTASRFVRDLGAGFRGSVNLVALLGASGTPVRNILRHPLALDNAVWVRTSATIPPETSLNDPFGGRRAWKLTDNADVGPHRIRQTHAKVSWATGLWPQLTASAWAQAGPTLDRVAITISDGSVNAARARFQLTGDGTVTETSGSGWLLDTPAATIVSVGDGWYFCTLTATETVNSGSDIAFDLNTLNANNNASYSGAGDHVLVYGPQLEFGNAATAFTDGGSGRSALWRVRTDPTAAGAVTESAAVDSNLMHLTPDVGDHSGRSSTLGLWWYPTGSPYRYVAVDVDDRDSTLGHLDVGRIFISQGQQLPVNPREGFLRPSHAATADRLRSLAGHARPRPRRPVRRGGGELILTTDAVRSWYRDLARQVGASGEALLIVDPTSAELLDDAVYGGFTDLGQPGMLSGGDEVAQFGFEEW